jgi:glycogen synthase
LLHGHRPLESPFAVRNRFVLAFVSYETALAPCGGIAAVLARLPAHVAAQARQPVVVFTPFHHRIPKTRDVNATWVGAVGVPFDGRTVQVQVLRHDGPAPHYLLRPEDLQFFTGTRHPYDLHPDTLYRDAVFFGAAVVQALRVVAPGAPWTLLLQDWESATVAMAVAGQPARPRMFVTLHNSYDHEAGTDQLRHWRLAPHACHGETVLQRALAVCEWPVFTVSQQFARDLIDDPYQTRVLAPHLASWLGSRLVGIDNGPFTDLAVPAELLAAAEAGRFQPLLAWKQDHQATFLKALGQLIPSADRPVWGNLARFGRGNTPLFVMAGRDDCRQKGYDVAASAAERLLDGGTAARFVFFPIPGDEGLEGLTFLRELAERCPANVLAFPFRFAEGFAGALRGATCGIMPSLYEPFGMANEFYLNGTLGIGRATGGVLQQIVPDARAKSTTAAVLRRTAGVHAPKASPTGFLFHEPDGLATEVEDWQGINATGYLDPALDLNRVQDRLRFPLFESLVAELTTALADAVALTEEPAEYARRLVAGIRHIEQGFSWDRAAQQYLRYAGG